MLKARNKVFVWYGQLSNNVEKTFAKNILAKEVINNLFVHAVYWSLKGFPVTEISEGSEPADWWTLLGGKETYPSYSQSIRTEPRLFTGSSASGVFVVEEISPFVQVLPVLLCFTLLIYC